MKYYITIPYNRPLHLDLVTRTTIPCKGRELTMSFVFDSLADNEADILISHLFNNL